MKIFRQKEKNFVNDLNFFLKSRLEENNKSIDLKVKAIINEVRTHGDNALIKYS